MQTQSNFGWNGPDKVDVRVTNRTGASVAVGDVVLLDHGRDDAASTTNAPGFSTAGLANIVDIADLGAGAARQTAYACGIWGCVLKAAADDGVTSVRLCGAVDSLRLDAAAVPATANVVPPEPGTPLAAHVATTTNTADADDRPKKVIAIVLVDPGAAGLGSGWFDGIRGFGSVLHTPG